ncbi:MULTISPECIES: hypothetical protein [unclassified Spirosoma]|uniref:hypothetical protein n=1 Tax=unclassified Spirosoma TaxID=2621999 RepID=UPI000962AC0E|nr:MULTISPECIES: hypothetical protein [unclassified Spirosoma]MBN8825606.1 hypothetical protein [Spirosoma sp.]OJW71690.1 MAG: hypothetical protein BGO59_27380 [Spirosoma sp. 48-14]
MKKRYYNFLVYRLLCLLIALTVLNVSIDVQSTLLRSEQTTVDHKELSVNQIESIGEFILEECLGMQDAIPEHDGPDESELTEPEQDYDFAPFFVFAPKRLPVQYLLSGNIAFRPEFVSTCVLEIQAPPPQPVA